MQKGLENAGKKKRLIRHKITVQAFLFTFRLYYALE